MCGIVGAIAERNVVPILIEGLKRLEYRGYDSAGIAVLGEHRIERLREVGKVAALAESVIQHKLTGNIGIAHTRWATHGKPTEANAHPHISGDNIALVHNGIIENYAELKAELIQQGVVFTSQTDTEVVAHLVQQAWLKTQDVLAAVQMIIPRLKGAYGLLILQRDVERLIAVRSGSPLVIGLGIGENFVASDSLSLLPVTQRFIYLEEGDVAEITRAEVRIFDKQNQPVERSVVVQTQTADAASKGQYKHFMQKEIAEQPVAVAQTLAAGFDTDGELNIAAFGEKAASILPKIKHIRIVACGTSFHAGLLAKYWLEQYAHIACEVEVASEFRYRQSVSQPDSLLIIISQSGETADSLAALRQAKPHYAASLAICNVPTSSLVRETDLVFLTRAGIELGVASTKAFTTQLTALLLLTFNLAKLRNTLNAATLQSLIAEFRTAPVLLQQALDLEPQIQNLAKRFRHKQHALYLGRGVYYPLALEGALKLKEISYIHAEAYPAGELKHGPLALVDEHMPIVAMVPNNGLFEKMHGNLQEVKARGGELLMITETALIEKLGLPGDVLSLPHVPDIIGPLVYCVPLQLLSYHVALCKGTDVDQPRNLAKSVTVE